VSIAVESKQLQVISSPTRNRAAMVAFSVPLCRRGRASAALISLPPFLSTNIVRLTGANGKTDDDLRPSLLLRGGTP
jgi:hypothetical protein